ncbi:hypothetical protein EDC37_102116 [Pectinatus cerevisiiphilus]|uniref:Uncharacterized protein n=1 Tax=Pectinatus cerevisiiphilus TaxID=86956 RepID=A0A4R3KEA1_9FIRM|nr:hypothetical protein EDC37_102116 [Pectinatus cerevisiiphilus]
MAHTYSNLPLEKMLLQFMTEDDPMLAMLKWLCEKLMETEVNAKINAAIFPPEYCNSSFDEAAFHCNSGYIH